MSPGGPRAVVLHGQPAFPCLAPDLCPAPALGQGPGSSGARTPQGPPAHSMGQNRAWNLPGSARAGATSHCLDPREPGFTLGVRVKRSCQSVKAWVEVYITLRVMSAENVVTKFSGVSYLPAFMMWALGASTARQNAFFQSAV